MPYNNKDIKESNVSYLNKDFKSLKKSLINYSKTYFPDSYRDFNETSPGMMLIEMSAYVGDVLSFYIDQQYKEMMLPLAEERRNLINMANMFGYKVKSIVPAYVDLTFTQLVNATSTAEDTVDYTNASLFDKGIKVISITNPDIVFETLDVVDFTVTASQGSKIYVSGDTSDVYSTDSTTGLVDQYRLSRKVRAISGETKTKTFAIGAPEKFKRITLPDTNVIDIISCVDLNNNKWHYNY